MKLLASTLAGGRLSSMYLLLVLLLLLESTIVSATTQQVLFSDGFENGWDGWIDGGANAARIDGSAWGNARTGNWAIRLRDNTAESIITKGINVQAYDKLTMIFYFKPRRMTGAAESFHLDAQKDGGAFLSVEEWTPQDMVEGQFNRGEVDIDVTGISNVIIRFRCVGDTSTDRIFLDDIMAIGTQSGGPAPTPTPVPTPTPQGPSPQPVVLFSDGFENGWDGWLDGGANAARIDGSAWGNARTGNWAIRLMDNTAESTIIKSINVQAYDKLTMIFYFKPRRMTGAAESFHLDAQKDGGAFLSVEEWTPQDMVEGQFNRGEVDIDVTGISNVIIRFRCVGDTSTDRIFLDDIMAVGTQSGGPAPTPTPVPSPMPPGPFGPAKFFVLKEQKGDDRFCIGIRESNPDVNDRVVVMKCDRYDDTQRWFAPENDPAYGGYAGRIRSFVNQDLCFYAYEKREKKPIRLQRCDRGNDLSSIRHNIVWDYEPNNGGCPDQGDCEDLHTYAEINISNLNSKCKVGGDRTNCHNLCLSYNGNNLDNEDYLRTKNVDLMDKKCEGADRDIWAWGWLDQFDDTGDQ